MSWLSTDTIKQKILNNADEATWQAFDNVYPADELPSTIPHYPIFIVLNTHPHNLDGQHWSYFYSQRSSR